MTAIKCSEEVLAVAEANNQLLLDMHPKLYKHGDHNMFYSAVSVSSMLTMMWESFVNKKSPASLKLLHFLRLNPGKELLFTAGYAEVLKKYERLTYGPNDASLNILNKMYISDSLGALKDDFLAKVHGDYRCSQEILSFANVHTAVEKINSDFSRGSNDLVTEAVSEANGDVTSASKIVLVSTLVFRGIWEVPFKADETKAGLFTKKDGTTVTVQMMHKKRAPGMSYTNFRNIGCHACAMYFEGFRYCMIVVRSSRIQRGAASDPVRNWQPHTMRECLMPDKLIAHFKRYHRKSRRGEGGLLVTIALPRFRITTGQVLNRTLSEVDKNISPFEVDASANCPHMMFSDAFATLPANPRHPAVTQIIQKCVIEIDERGSAASDERAPILPSRPSWKSRPKCVKMIVDKAFYFVLYDYTNNFLIAAGIVDDPTSSE